MVKMVLDPALGAKLQGVDEAQLCDESGHALGRFLSEDAFRRLVYESAAARVTEEELRRRLAEPGGRPLAEILTGQ